MVVNIRLGKKEYYWLTVQDILKSSYAVPYWAPLCLKYRKTVLSFEFILRNFCGFNSFTYSSASHFSDHVHWNHLLSAALPRVWEVRTQIIIYFKKCGGFYNFTYSSTRHLPDHVIVCHILGATFRECQKTEKSVLNTSVF